MSHRGLQCRACASHWTSTWSPGNLSFQPFRGILAAGKRIAEPAQGFLDCVRLSSIALPVPDHGKLLRDVHGTGEWNFACNRHILGAAARHRAVVCLPGMDAPSEVVRNDS